MLGWLPNPLIIPVGLIIGILIAAPVGPVNVLCIRRSVEHGMLAGVVVGLGAVLADGMIAFLAALGVGAISGLVESYGNIIQLVGAMVLLFYGVRLMIAKSKLQVAAIRDISPIEAFEKKRMLRVARRLIWDFPTGFFLTITNPAAVLGLFAIIGGISSFVEIRGPVEAMILVGAIMVGSLTWWVSLSVAIGWIRGRIDMQWLPRINQGAGALLTAFGVLLFIDLASTVFLN